MVKTPTAIINPSKLHQPDKSELVEWMDEKDRGAAGAAFNVLDYIRREAGGPAQVDLILAGNYVSQNKFIVTAGIQAAFVALYDSQVSGAVVFPAGEYAVNDGLLNGVTSGKAVCKHIYDDGLPNLANGQRVTWEIAASGAARINVNANFSDSQFAAGTFPDKVLFRFDVEGASKPFNGLVGKMPKMYWWGSRDERWQCPTAIKLRNTNGMNMDFGSNGPRGDNFNWPGTGILIDGASNADLFGVRVRAGETPLEHEVYSVQEDEFTFTASSGELVHVSNPGDPSAFDPPTGETGTWFVGKKMLLADSDTSADRHLVKILTQDDVKTVTLEAASRPSSDLASHHATFGLPSCAVSDVSNVITVDQPDVVDDDMVGKLIFIEAAPDNRTGTGMTLAYVSAVDTGTKQLTLVGNDGVAIAFGASASNVTWWMGGGLVICQVYNQTYNGKNDDITIHSASAEKCGGVQVFLQGCSGVTLVGGKGHGRDAIGGSQEQDFGRAGLCYGFDNCEEVSIYASKITWPCYINRADDRVLSMKAWGDENAITFRDCEVFGSANLWDVIDVSQVGDDNCIRWDGGEMRSNGWKASDVTHNLVGGIAGSGLSKIVNTVDVGLPMYVKQSGAADGFRDALGIYRNTLREEVVTIVSNAVTVEEGNLIVLEATGASTDLHSINGLHDGKTGVITILNGGNDVVIRHQAIGGNIQTSDGLGITLDAQRKHVRYLFREGRVRIDSGTSA